jgi:MFS family permease
VLGVLSDRYGRRPVLVFSILGSALGFFVFGWAATLWLMFLARIVDGITGGNISTAQACLADISSPQDRAKNFGLIGMAFGLGFIIGPALGGVLSKISIHAPAYGAGCMALLTSVFAFFLLPETLPPERRKTGRAQWSDLNPLRPVVAAFQNASLRALLVSLFLLNFAFAALQTNFSLFTLARFQWSAADNAWVFAFIGIMVAFNQGFLIRRLTQVAQERTLAMCGFALFAPGFLLIAVATEGWMLYLASGLIATGSSFTNPTLTSFISQRVSNREQGSILGTTQAVLSLTRVFGPLWAGLVFDRFGASSPYWSGAVFILVAALCAWPVFRK